MSAQKLSILVHPSLVGDEITRLSQKGHQIALMQGSLLEYDLILGPNCWQIMPKLLKYLDLAVKEARKQKKAT